MQQILQTHRIKSFTTRLKPPLAIAIHKLEQTFSFTSNAIEKKKSCTLKAPKLSNVIFYAYTEKKMGKQTPKGIEEKKS